MGYPAGQRRRSIPLWSVRGFHNHLPIDPLRLTQYLCVLSLSLSFLPSLLLFHPPFNQQHYAHQLTLRWPTYHHQTLLVSQAMV